MLIEVGLQIVDVIKVAYYCLQTERMLHLGLAEASRFNSPSSTDLSVFGQQEIK